jgi:hypothetical protein
MLNYSKRKSHIFVLIIVLCTDCYGTTAVFIINPTQIIAGIDRTTNDVGLTGQLVQSAPITKISLLKGRFIVACVGLEKMKMGPSAEKQVTTYNFQEWIKGIETQITPDNSVASVVDIIERESAKTFSETVPVETMMKNGAIKHIPALDKFLVTFIVAGFDRGIVTLIHTYYELDWKNNRLIGPTRVTELPNGNIDVALYADGLRCAIDANNLTNLNSYAYKRMSVLAPTAFKKILALKPISQTEGVQVVRGLISVEAEVEPSEVGSGANVVVLPKIGTGTVMQYEHSLTVGAQRTAHHNSH